MKPREILSREMSEKVGDTISKETISEKVDQFMKYGNLFLFFEVMNLRKEIGKIEEEMQSIKDVIENLRVPLARA